MEATRTLDLSAHGVANAVRGQRFCRWERRPRAGFVHAISDGRALLTTAQPERLRPRTARGAMARWGRNSMRLASGATAGSRTATRADGYCLRSGLATRGTTVLVVNSSDRSASPIRCRKSPVNVLNRASPGAAVPVPVGRLTQRLIF
jgi:hypothetical protein